MRIEDFKLERYFAKYEFKAPYILCASDCESFTVEEILKWDESSENQLKNLWLGYTESQGNPELRDEISKLYLNIKAEDIIVFSGAEEGIFIFMNIILQPGDNIIVQSPCYQSLYQIAHSIGCQVTEWVMDFENNWELNIDFLEQNLTRKTKAIIINSPNNPTGYSIPPDIFQQIINIARSKNLYIFSDEVYRLLEYNPQDRLPPMSDIYDKAISLGVMSKSFGLPGLRIGWIASRDRSLLSKIASFKDFTTICNSAPSELISMLALKNKDFILKRNLKIINANLKLLEDFFQKFSSLFDWYKPKAGALTFPKLKFEMESEAFCLDLLNQKGVLLLPSNNYNFNNKHVRIGFGRKNMPEALSKMAEYMEQKILR